MILSMRSLIRTSLKACGITMLIAPFCAVVPAYTAEPELPLIITFAEQAGSHEGDHDKRQLIRFSVPMETAGSIYFRVFDADTGGAHDEAIGGFNTAMRYTIYGSEGTASLSRGADGVLVEQISGTMLETIEIGHDRALDNQWTTLFEVDAQAGKIVGNGREFFVLIEGMKGNDGNLFDVRLSTRTETNVAPLGAKLYSFLPSVRVPRRGKVTELSFVAPKQASHLRIENFDSADGQVTFASKFRSLPLAPSGQNEWASSTVELASDERGKLVSVTVGGGREMPNDVSLYIADEADRPIAISLPPRSFSPGARPELELNQTPLSCASIRFDAAGSRDPEGTDLTYRWSFADGTVKTDPVIIHDFAKAGTTPARLEIFDASGLVGNGTAQDFEVSVKAPPQAGFEARDVIALGQTLVLDARSSVPALPQGLSLTRYSWDMGDGTRLEGGDAVVNHTYAANGTYVVTLTVRDNSGHPCDFGVLKKAIVVNAAPVADAGNAQMLADGATVSFDARGSSDADGDQLSYRWDLGDGTILAEQTGRHTYAKPGSYTARLSVDDGRGAANSVQDVRVSVFINAAPIAKMNLPTFMLTGEPGEFDGRQSFDPDGEILQLKWLLPNGKTVERGSFRHAFFAAGDYEISLQVTDDSGLENGLTTLTRLVRVVDPDNRAPIAEAGGDRETRVGDIVTFDGSGSRDPDGSILAYTWDFGDGRVGSGLSVAHVYGLADTYSGSLSVTDSSGKANAQSKSRFTVVVKQALNQAVVVRAGGDRTGYVDEVIEFDATGTRDVDGNAISLAWGFGDGEKAQGFSVRHSYDQPGTYRVHLVVTDDSGRSNRQSETSFDVVISHAPNSAPSAEIGAMVRATSGELIRFDATSARDDDGEIVAYLWDFGDGSTTDQAIADHAYAVPGTYSGFLTLTDDSRLPSGIAVVPFTALVETARNQSPIARAGGDVQVVVGEMFALSGSDSRDEDGSVIGYAWDLGNGKKVRGEKIRFTYFVAGTYDVELSVTDNSGQTNAVARDRLQVYVGDAPNATPVASVKPDRGAAIDEPVPFSGGQSGDVDGNIISYDWDFGDGTSGSGREVSHSYVRSGKYLAWLRIVDDSGLASGHAKIARLITVNEPPVANAGTDQHVTASVVHFDASGSHDLDGAIVRYSWDFGDGQTGAGKVISHTYREPGTYAVTLAIADDSGTIRNSDSDSMSVRLNALPVADAGPDIVGAPQEIIAFDGSRSIDPDGAIAHYVWDFKDGTQGRGAQVVHSFDRPGTYYVSLNVLDDSAHENAIDNSTAQVIINARPVARAGRDLEIAPGESFALSGVDSYDSDGEITQWRWDFSDGLQSATVAQIERSFEEPGIYRATLTTSDNSVASNNTNQDSLEIFVNHGPVAEAGKDIFRDVLHVVFDGTGSLDADNDGLSYTWDLGNGNVAQGARVSHVYATGGIYPVILRVDDGRGLANSVHRDSMKVEINRPPVAVAGDDRAVCVGDTVVFDGSASSDPDNGPIRYAWTFGDGQDAGSINPTRTFSEPGIYPVQLTVEDESGLANNQHRDSLLVSVNAAPVAHAGEDILACANTDVQFDGSASTDIDGVVNRFSWLFGDNASGGGDRPKHVYTTAGTYHAALSITGDSLGLCSPSARDEILVKIVNAPRGVITADKAVADGQEVSFDASLSYADGGTITDYVWDFGDGTSARGKIVQHLYDKPGTYRVGLTINAPELAQQCQQNTVWHVIRVNDAPVADAGGNRTVAVDRVLALTGIGSSDSDGGITGYSWDFGDGSAASGQDVRHVWREPGQYRVTLRVTDDMDLVNNNASTQILVDVQPAPHTQIVTAQTACADEVVEFDLINLGERIDRDTLRWTFGDGETLIGAQAQHRFAKAGTYSIGVGGSVSGTDTVTQSYVSHSLKINRPPVAEPGSFRKTCPGEPVRFDGSRSFDFDGAITSYDWDFGDGQSQSGAQVSHSFEAPGTYSVALKVDDGSGSGCATTVGTVEVFVNAPPVADAGPDIAAWTGGARDRISFDAGGSRDADGDALDYYWELSNGAEFDGEKPGHVFTRPGTFTAELTAADTHDLSCSYASDSVTITVRARD